MKINPKLYHIALALYLLAIFVLSSMPGETFPKVDFEFSDKIVHVIVYGILFTLFFYSLKNQTKYVKLHEQSLNYSLLFTAIYGMTDEIHQYFVHNRSCEFADWVADVAGALIMYIILKYFVSKKMKIAIFLLVIFAGCSGTDDKNIPDNTKYYFTEHDVWINQMPSTNPKTSNLGFNLSLSLETNEKKDDFSVSDFKVYLNNDTIRNKKFNYDVFNSGDSVLKINVTSDNNIMYLDKNKYLPEDAQFEYNVLKKNKLYKKIKTPNLIIIKVY